MKFRLSEMSWPEVGDLLSQRNAVLIPVGSTEQHGLHLPLNVDSACSTYLSERAAEKVNASGKIRAVVAPTIHYTEVYTFSSYPGSIGITLDTETRLIADICRSFIAQGFSNLIFVNGHNSNIIPINMALRQVNDEHPDAGIYALNWYSLGFDTASKTLKSKIGLHADELETSLSLFIQPENVDMDQAEKWIPGYSLSGKWVKPDFHSPNRVFYHSRKRYPVAGVDSGVMGDPAVASRETGERIAEAVVSDLAEIIVEVVNSERGKD